MQILVYGVAMCIALFAELFPTVHPIRKVEDYEHYVTFLQIVIFVLVLCSAYFYGRLE